MRALYPLVTSGILVLAGAFGAAPAAASDAPDLKGAKLTMRLEIGGARGIEQVAVAFKEQEVLLSSNSNFALPAERGETARVGLFRAPMNDELRSLQKYIEQAARRAVPESRGVDPERGPGDAHVARLYLNGVEIPQSSSYRKGLIKRMKALYDRDGWQIVNGAEARLEPKADRAAVAVLGSAPVKAGRYRCFGSSNGPKVCKLPGAGTVHFRAPSSSAH